MCVLFVVIFRKGKKEREKNHRITFFLEKYRGIVLVTKLAAPAEEKETRKQLLYHMNGILIAVAFIGWEIQDLQRII